VIRLSLSTKSRRYAWRVGQSLSGEGLRQEIVSSGRSLSKPRVVPITTLECPGVGPVRQVKLSRSWRDKPKRESGRFCTVSSGVVQESPTVLIGEVPEGRVRTPSITSQKGERSVGTVSRGVVQESPTVSTHEVPDRRMPETPSTRSHATSSRAASTARSSAKEGEAYTRRRSEVKREAASWRLALTFRAI